MTCEEALKTISDAMSADLSYAWGWHCNVAMVAVDAGADHKEANERAASFMRNTFDVDVTQMKEYKAIVES